MIVKNPVPKIGIRNANWKMRKIAIAFAGDLVRNEAANPVTR
jgi:hypothetical protein